MRKYIHLAWYALGLLSLTGLWLGWSWFQEPLFPLVCFLSGRLTKYELGGHDTIFDRTFRSRWLGRFAALSVVVVIVGITGWFYYFKYVYAPASERQGVQEYLSAREALLKEKAK